MQATAAIPQPTSRPLSRFSGILRSEMCKLRTVRSTFWALAAAVVFNVAVAAVLAIVLPSHLSAHQKATIDSVRVSLGGLHLSQIAIGLLGVLAITSEYSTGMIRATLVTGIGASFAAYLIFEAFLPAGDAMRTSLAGPVALRAVTGAGLYLTVLGLLGFGLGAVIRSSAGAVAALFGLLFIPTLLAALLPAGWQDTIGPYLPMNAGESIYTVQHQAHTLQSWPGLGVFCLYAAAALAAGFVLISRRDA